MRRSFSQSSLIKVLIFKKTTFCFEIITLILKMNSSEVHRDYVHQTNLIDDVLVLTAKNSFKVGRFQVQTKANKTKFENPSSLFQRKDSYIIVDGYSSLKKTFQPNKSHRRKFSDISKYFFEKSSPRNRSNTLPAQNEIEEVKISLSDSHPYASILNEINGDTKIYHRGVTKSVTNGI